MKLTDQQLLEEAYSTINEGKDNTPVQILKGPVMTHVTIEDYYVSLNGTDYLYRTTHTPGSSKRPGSNIKKEELFIGFGDNDPKPTPGSNVVDSPSHEKTLKLIRKAVANPANRPTEKVFQKDLRDKYSKPSDHGRQKPYGSTGTTGW